MIDDINVIPIPNSIQHLRKKFMNSRENKPKSIPLKRINLKKSKEKIQMFTSFKSVDIFRRNLFKNKKNQCLKQLPFDVQQKNKQNNNNRIDIKSQLNYMKQLLTQLCLFLSNKKKAGKEQIKKFFIQFSGSNAFNQSIQISFKTFTFGKNYQIKKKKLYLTMIQQTFILKNKKFLFSNHQFHSKINALLQKYQSFLQNLNSKEFFECQLGMLPYNALLSTISPLQASEQHAEFSLDNFSLQQMNYNQQYYQNLEKDQELEQKQEYKVKQNNNIKQKVKINQQGKMSWILNVKSIFDHKEKIQNIRNQFYSENGINQDLKKPQNIQLPKFFLNKPMTVQSGMIYNLFVDWQNQLQKLISIYDKKLTSQQMDQL